MDLKQIHSFDVIRKIKQEVTEETEKGKLTKEIEVEAPLTVVIKKPSRIEGEEADTVYAVEYARCCRLGMLTNALMEKLYANEDGFLSKEDKERYTHQYARFLGLQEEYQRLNVKSKKTKADQEKMSKITSEWFEIQRDLQELQSTRNDLFRNTAETKARDKTITWLTLFLTYIKEENGTTYPFFSGNNDAEKLADFDRITEEEEPYKLDIINKASLYISLWYMGKLVEPEDFKSFEKLMINQELGAVEVEEPEKKDEVKVATTE